MKRITEQKIVEMIKVAIAAMIALFVVFMLSGCATRSYVDDQVDLHIAIQRSAISARFAVHEYKELQHRERLERRIKELERGAQ